MHTIGLWRVWVVVMALLVQRSAWAKTILAPVGGGAIALDNTIFCPSEWPLNGWQIGENGQVLLPPKAAATAANVKIATASCANIIAEVSLVAYEHWPLIDAQSTILRIDEPRLVLNGKFLQKSLFQISDVRHQGSDICDDTILVGDSQQESCNFVVPANLSSKPDEVMFSVYPPNTPVADSEYIAFDTKAKPLVIPQYSPAKIVLRTVVDEATILSSRSKTSSIDLHHADAVVSVTCEPANCRVDGATVLVDHVKDDHGFLNFVFQLQPHVYWQNNKKELQNHFTLSLPWTRCSMSLASGEPLGDIRDQNIVLKITGICSYFTEEDMWIKINDRLHPIATSVLANKALYAVVSLTQTIDSTVNVVLLHRDRLMAATVVKARPLPVVRAALHLPELGEIDFIPTNRFAELDIASQNDSKLLVLLPRNHVYAVDRSQASKTLVRAQSGSNGFVNLRFAWRERDLPIDLQTLNLAEFTENTERKVKVANIPLSLTGSDPWIELFCPLHGHSQPIQPGTTQSLQYLNRHGCYLMFHSEKISEEDGEQQVSIKVTVESLDSRPKPQFSFDHVLRFRAGQKPKQIFISGGDQHFDKVFVRLNVQGDDAGRVDGNGVTSLQWAMVMGRDHLRFYASAALPSGLFRAADPTHSGIISLSFACLFRLEGLTPAGIPLPPGFELGILWEHITNDSTNNPYGEIAIVAGLGIAVPIGNVSQASQATIGVHLWGEYEVSRKVTGETGTPWGIIVGPSVSFGNVGVSF